MVSVTLEDEVEPRRGSGVWRRSIRKHRTAVVMAGLYLIVFFFPSIFMGRLVSPNDVYRHYEPWSTASPFIAQNPVIHDPPMAYMPLAAMMKAEPESFHWNPWIASGIPGWGSAASALLTPFVLIPALLPLPFFYTGVIVLKFLFAFVMTYLWLREERLGKSNAAIGALVGAASGPMFALWLWQSTNATVLYPALLYAIARMIQGKKNPTIALTLLGVAFLLSGYPASIAFGVWLGLFYGIVGVIRTRRVPFKELGRALLAGALALMITAPLLDPFVTFLKRTGYLESREDMARFSFSPEHLTGLFNHRYFGNPAEGLWRGDRNLGPLDNYVELTIWVGPIVGLLALIALLDRRARVRVMAWTAFGALVILVMIGMIHFGWILDLPGVRYSPVTRFRILLPPIFAFLAASGLRAIGQFLRRRIPVRVSFLALAFGSIVAYDYARVAASFHPYLPIDETAVESRPSLEFLQRAQPPFRVAPTFFWMMPNSSQMFGIEDIRSQWSSESSYREIVRRIDPQAGQNGSVLLLSSLSMNVEAPSLRLLNVRYILEPPAIDILRWRIEERLEKLAIPDREGVLPAGESITTFLRVGSDEAKTIEVTAWPEDRRSAPGRLSITLIRPETGAAFASATKTAAQLVRSSKLHVPLRDVGSGEVVELEITAHGAAFTLPFTGAEPFLRVSTSSLALVDEGADARIYEIVDTWPRYRATWEIVNGSLQELLADADLDLQRFTAAENADRALIERLSSVPVRDRRVTFRILDYGPSTQKVRVRSDVPFLLTASEKLTPELRVLVDGEEVRPLPVNGIFVGIPLERGEHTIVFMRRIGRNWWLLSVLGLVALGTAGITDRRWW